MIPSHGLSSVEAQKRLAEAGKNILPKKRKKTVIEIFLKQLANPLIFILISAGLITSLLGEWLETAVIGAAVFFNAMMGLWQEWKAQDVLAKMESYIQTRSKVKRDGVVHEVAAEELVIGDLISLSSGERIPADAKITFSSSLSVDESILTGESLPVEKKVDDMLYGGTLISDGIGEASIIATGKNMEFGRIAELAGNQDVITPLQESITKLSKYIGIFTVVLTIGFFYFGIITGHQWLEILILAVAVGVSIVPEGLPIALTVILAIGVERLAKRKGIVRKLLAAETLGSITVILTDKTGTLTQANLSLASIEPIGCSKEELLKLASLAADVVIQNPNDDPSAWKIIGRPVEVALIKGAIQHGAYANDQKKAWTIINRIPFNSKVKYSGVIIKQQKTIRELFIGAPDVLSSKPLHLEAKTNTGERMIGIAEKNPKTGSIKLIGILGFRDALRPNIKKSILGIAQTGVKTVMVTGDHPGTALAIAKEAGISTKGGVITGAEIESFDDETLQKKIKNTRIFARVTPEHKWRLVKAYRQSGEIVAVTGDGVNYAPALREADIGVAVGSGTDIAKDVADLVILDNNFQTIIEAIHEGRRMLSNIRKITTYLLTNSSGALLLVTSAFIADIPSPITALQILYINFFTDGFPAVGFAFEEGMDANPRTSSRERVLDKKIIRLIAICAFGSATILFSGYVLMYQMNMDIARIQTITFGTLGIKTLIIAYALRRFNRGIWNIPPSNKPMLIGLSIGACLMIAAIYIPQMQSIFGTKSLALPELMLMLTWSIIASIPAEIAKRFSHSA